MAICHNFNQINLHIPITNTDLANLVRRFRETGSIFSVNETKQQILKRKSYDQEQIDKVHYVVNQDPQTSIDYGDQYKNDQPDT